MIWICITTALIITLAITLGYVKGTAVKIIFGCLLGLNVISLLLNIVIAMDHVTAINNAARQQGVYVDIDYFPNISVELKCGAELAMENHQLVITGTPTVVTAALVGQICGPTPSTSTK